VTVVLARVPEPKPGAVSGLGASSAAVPASGPISFFFPFP
jgi:hypothetical protein